MSIRFDPNSIEEITLVDLARNATRKRTNLRRFMNEDVRNRLQQGRASSSPSSNNESSSGKEILHWSPHLSALLAGVRDPTSPLRILRGNEESVIRNIYSILVETWRAAVTLTPPAEAVSRLPDGDIYSMRHRQRLPDDNLLDVYQPSQRRTVFLRSVLLNGDLVVNPPIARQLGNKVTDRPEIAFSSCGRIYFPEPRDINVNMLPFILGDRDSLPDGLGPYYDDAIARCPVHESELGKVCYLTVCEGQVDTGNTQRRRGLHIEAPNAKFLSRASFTAAYEVLHWGHGRCITPDEFHGGLFLASNMAGTSAVWDALVNDSEVVDDHGGIDHLRPFIGREHVLAANELIWLTDRTPHEALPQRGSGYRQFFRLVTSEISVWFKEHSTPNPKVPLPDHVRVIEGSKFG